MHQPVVSCEVETCIHWLPGKLCSAAEIDILNEEEKKMSQTAAQTECKTFSKREGIANYLGGMDNVNWQGLAMSVFKEGQQTNPFVACIVNSCLYWQEGNSCSADEISVTGSGANECQDTDCRTFTKKEE